MNAQAKNSSNRETLRFLFYIYMGLIPLAGLFANAMMVRETESLPYGGAISGLPGLFMFHFICCIFLPLFMFVFYKSLQFPSNTWLALWVLIDAPLQMLLLPIFGISVNWKEWLLMEFSIEYIGFAFGFIGAMIKLGIEERQSPDYKPKEKGFDLVGIGILFFLTLFLLLPAIGFTYLDFAIAAQYSWWGILPLATGLISTFLGYYTHIEKLPEKSPYADSPLIKSLLSLFLLLQLLIGTCLCIWSLMMVAQYLPNVS